MRAQRCCAVLCWAYSLKKLVLQRKAALIKGSAATQGRPVQRQASGQASDPENGKKRRHSKHDKEHHKRHKHTKTKDSAQVQSAFRHLITRLSTLCSAGDSVCNFGQLSAPRSLLCYKQNSPHNHKQTSQCTVKAACPSAWAEGLCMARTMIVNL